MSLAIDKNTAYGPIAQRKLHEHTLDQYLGFTVEQLETEGGGSMRQLSEEEVEALKHMPVYLHKDADVFTSKDISSWLSSNTYVYVDNVLFSAEELKACNEIVNKATAFLPAKGSSLEYYDYATLGIAANVVNTYADENLSEQQAEVLKRAMNSYLDSFVQAEQEKYQSGNYYHDDNAYYSLRAIPDEATRNGLAQLREQALKLPNGAGDQLANFISRILDEGEASVVMSATNRELTGAVRSLFEGVDLKDEDAVSKTLEIYRKLVAPAYSLRNTKGVENRMKILLSNAKAVVSGAGKKVDCGV